MESRLRGAKEDIVRLSDLLVELEERKKALRSDWETAREYHRLVSKKMKSSLCGSIRSRRSPAGCRTQRGALKGT